MKRALCFILLAAMLIGVLASCAAADQGDNNEDNGKNTVTDASHTYVITRPEKASDTVRECAKELRTALAGAGIDVNMTTDWYQNESEIPEYEILIGDTNRPESATVKASIAEGESWKIQKVGKKIVIVGLTDYSIKSAVTGFIEQKINTEGKDVLEKDISLAGADAVDDTPIEFLWKDGKISTISGGAWGPRVYTMSNGDLIAGYETSQGIKTATSSNNAKSWKNITVASFRPDRSCANVNFFEFEGKVYLSYRATGKQSDGYYTSLQVSVSEDFGLTWSHHSTIAENVNKEGNTRGVWEPCLGNMNGKLTVMFADERNTGLQNICQMHWDAANGKWTGLRIVSNGQNHNSRDGMPVWINLSEGGYALVIESSRYGGTYPFIIQLLYSADGKTWGAPVDVYIPTSTGSKAGAPGIIELPTGQIVISFQTDEDQTQKGDKYSVMKTIISDGTAVNKLKKKNFTESDNVFGTPDNEGSVWTGIWYADGWLYAAAGTKSGAQLNMIQLR